MMRKIVDALVEFFGSLWGIPSVINRPLHDSRGQQSMPDDLHPQIPPPPKPGDMIKDLRESDAFRRFRR